MNHDLSLDLKLGSYPNPGSLTRSLAQVDVFDYQLLYTSFFTASEDRNLNTPDPSTGLMGERLCLRHHPPPFP
jgi:hypothetical protein